MFSLKKMVNDNIYRKNQLILPRALKPVRGMDQEEHEFLSFANQSGSEHNERINKFLNQQQHKIHWNGFKDFHWHQQHQEGLEPNDQYCDVNIHRSGLHLQSLSEKRDMRRQAEMLRNAHLHEPNLHHNVYPLVPSHRGKSLTRK